MSTLQQQAAELVLDDSTRRIVRYELGKYGLVDELDDVVAETGLSVLKSLGSYDPMKGSLRAWVTRIAQRRAKDQCDKAVSRGRLDAKLRAAAVGADTDLSVSEQDFAGDVASRVDGAAHAREVIALVAKFVANPESWTRTVALLSHQNIRTAAIALGISEGALRDSRREVSRCGAVVVQALATRRRRHREGCTSAPTMQDLYGCLPHDGADGSWSATITKAAVREGGFAQVTPTTLSAVTGYSINTARQYLAEAAHLLKVANTILSLPEEQLWAGTDIHPEPTGQNAR
ncbi:RNA polymerase sigma factor [Arthrobacter woluwensis]|uniref:Sigma-70 region 2 n=1 Tax=Arthrobacter woluwensis TaxID=156980 RepID=A0A1H4I821_9MICC|nr:sigma factor [Arthrobacter woluwensis]SEB30207.1 Sigma-70 region 2 [Arthrobacter woluwensis]